MNPWNMLRQEVGGAVRSLRYDLARRAGREVPPGYDAGDRDEARRRVVGLTVIGLLVAVGAVGVYFAVVGGLHALLAAVPVDGGAPPFRPVSSPSPRATGHPVAGIAARPTATPGTPSATASPTPHQAQAQAVLPTPRPAESPTCGNCNPPPPAPVPTTASPAPCPQPSPSPCPAPSPSTQPPPSGSAAPSPAAATAPPDR